MKRIFFAILFTLIHLFINGQQDSIYIYAKVYDNLRKVKINQTITLNKEKNTNHIYLLNWISAYKKKKSKLAHRALENRNKKLYFAKNDELGKLENLKIKIADSTYTITDNLDNEHLKINLPNHLANNKLIKIQLNYTLKLPLAKFTGYGTNENEALLKYFFLVPDSFNKYDSKRSYSNIEETANFKTHWEVDLEIPINYYSKSNLIENHSNHFQGFLNEDPIFLISKKNYPKIDLTIGEKPILIDFGYNVNPNELSHLKLLIPDQLRFINNQLNKLPTKLFISSKNKTEDDFFGNDDIVFYDLRLPLFSEKEKTDLDYFSILSTRIVNKLILGDMEESHAIKNGLKTYYEIEYLKKNYPNRRLLGDLVDLDFFGIKPLKWFHASKIKLTERYHFGYRYMMTRNLDQKISERFSNLSNMNNLVISHFESGRVLHYVSEKIGKKNFNIFLNYLVNKYQDEPITNNKFIKELTKFYPNEFDFINEIIHKKNRLNFKIKKEKSDKNSLLLAIKHNLPQGVSFPLETYDKMGVKKNFWLKTKTDKGTEKYEIKSPNTMKVVVNNPVYLSEENYRDNYLYPHHFLSNIKKIKLGFYKDIENPEYNEIYLNPRLNFNAYDNLLLGINFSNNAFLDKRFNYSFTPYYSFGTNKLMGSGSLIYRLLPPESFFRKISFGVSGSHFHYDYNYAYNKISLFTSFLMRKHYRSTINQQFTLSFNHYNKEVSPHIQNDNSYANYNLLNANYIFVDNRLIHEKRFGVGYQMMKDFQKISAEAFYRYEFSPNKKITLRGYGGFFINNKTKNNVFDFGISKVSNYSFSYGLLGQSATSGFFRQQFILADSGFKSYIAESANDWVTAINAEINIWKPIHLYGDIGLYKNKRENSKLIWDSGINLKILPDFLELYFPMYSSLGFEPSFKDYSQRIRFVLVFDIKSITNAVKRGWY